VGDGMGLRQFLAGALLIGLASPVLASGINPEPVMSGHDTTAIDRLVHDVCGKRIVLLGEDLHHGSGRTLELKTTITKRLIEHCGFRGVLFESSFYEFVHLQRVIDAGKAVPEDVADAIGAKWTAAESSRALVAYLFAKSVSGKVMLGGLDPQVGGRFSHYEAKQLAGDLVRYLPPDSRQSCLVVLRRHDRWNYDDEHPFDAAAKKSLRHCIHVVQRTLAGRHHGGKKFDEAAAMARSYASYVDMLTADRQTGAGLRDRAMFNHLRWFLARWPRGTKVIVWTATVHAIKRPIRSGSYKPLGAWVHEHYGAQAAAIGFTALGGSYGWPGQPAKPVVSPARRSLERLVSADSGPGPWYLDAGTLRRLGRVSGEVLSYAKPLTAPWSDLLDGVIVLSREHPPAPLRGTWSNVMP
jgi:erythromycin esterase-like protein